MTQVSYNSQVAITWGNLVEFAYTMYEADKHNLNPQQPSTFPSEWKIVANLAVNSKVAFVTQKEFIGFVVESTTDPSQAGIVFRGTDGVLDWLDDFECEMVAFTDVPNGGRVEDGFVKLYNSIEVLFPGQTETQTMTQYCSTLSDKSLVTISGHSLGGALANLAGIVLATQQPALNIELYTFAAPMTGDHTFAEVFNAKVVNSFRIYNKPDIVPTQPSVHLGYQQVNTGIEINSLLDPSIGRNLIKYHSLLTYLKVLQEQPQSK